MADLRTYVFDDGYTLQQSSLLRALKMQAEHGMLMTNPRVTGYTSFAKAVNENNIKDIVVRVFILGPMVN